MIPLTPRQAVLSLVERTSDRTGRPVWDVWRKLYDEFERVESYAVNRVSHNTGRTKLDTVDEEGWMPELLTRAQIYLKTIPAVPGKEKAPGQGSLIQETEEPA